MSDTLQRLLRIVFALAFNPARLMEDVASAARRLTILFACTIFAAFVLLPAIGCGAAGVWILVQQHLGPVWAAFITAAALALVAVIVLLVGVMVARGPRRHERAERGGAGSVAGPAVIEAAAAALPAFLALLSAPKKAAAAGAAVGRGFFARHKGAFLLAATVAGLVMGQDLFRRRPHRRPGEK